MFDPKPTVLVLDEDPLSLELYSRELSSDYQVITCETVQESRRYLQERPFAVVIIEPVVNQDEGWKLLRDIQEMPNPPLVILCSVEDDRRAGLGQGAYAYLVKPVLPATLHALVDEILAKKPFHPG